jgi:hypothetical protein
VWLLAQFELYSNAIELENQVMVVFYPEVQYNTRLLSYFLFDCVLAALVWSWSPFYPCFKKQALNLASVCQPHQFVFGFVKNF